jgi:large subunit ribosomal protein L25
MSEYGNITATVRTGRGKSAARQLRMAGLVPAVMYGRGGDNLSLTLDPHLLGKATDPAKLYNTLFHLSVEQEGEPTVVVPCLIADIQKDSVRSEVQHVDFMRVDVEQPVERKIPVRYFGRAAGVMVGGRLKTMRHMLMVSAKPAELPVELAIDLAPLEAGAYLRISDMSLPGATFLEDPHTPLAMIELPKAAREDEEEGEAEGEAAKEVKDDKKDKKDKKGKDDKKGKKGKK